MSAKSSMESHSSSEAATFTHGSAPTDAAMPVTMCTNQQALQTDAPCLSSEPMTPAQTLSNSPQSGASPQSQSSLNGAEHKSPAQEHSSAGQQQGPQSQQQANKATLPSYVQLQELEGRTNTASNTLIVTKDQLAGFNEVLKAFREQDYYYNQAQRLRNQKLKRAADHLTL